MECDSSDSECEFDTCRLCMLESNEFFDIFEVGSDGSSFQTKIKDAVDVDVTGNDGLSNLICTVCASRVEIVCDFRRLCKINDYKQKINLQKLHQSQEIDSNLTEKEQQNYENAVVKEEQILEDTVKVSDDNLQIENVDIYSQERSHGENISPLSSTQGIPQEQKIEDDEITIKEEPIFQDAVAFSDEEVDNIVKNEYADNITNFCNIRDKEMLAQHSVSAFVETDRDAIEINVPFAKKLKTGCNKKKNSVANKSITDFASGSMAKRQKIDRSTHKYKKSSAMQYRRAVRRKRFTCLYNCRYCYKEFRYKASLSNHERSCYKRLVSFKDVNSSDNSCGMSVGDQMHCFSPIPYQKKNSVITDSDPVNSNSQSVCYSVSTGEEGKRTNDNCTQTLTKEAEVQEQKSGNVVHSLQISDTVNNVDCGQKLLPADMEGAENEERKFGNIASRNEKMIMPYTLLKCTLCSVPFRDELTLKVHTELCGTKSKINGPVSVKCSTCNRNFRCLVSLKYHEAFCINGKTYKGNQNDRLKKSSNGERKGTENNLSTKSSPVTLFGPIEYEGHVNSQVFLEKESISKITPDQPRNNACIEYKCSHCLQIFKDRSDHYRHQEMCATISNGKSDKLALDNKASKIIEKGRKILKTLKCHYCDKKFRLRRRLTAHERKCQLHFNTLQYSTAASGECTVIVNSHQNIVQALPAALNSIKEEISIPSLTPAVYKEASFNTAVVNCDKELAHFSHEHGRSRTATVQDILIQPQAPENLYKNLDVSEYCHSINDSLSDSVCEKSVQGSSQKVQYCSLKNHSLSVEKNKFRCFYCGYFFKCKEKLAVHVKLCELKAKLIICKKCKQKFKSKLKFKLHTLSDCTSDHSYAKSCLKKFNEEKLMRNAVVRLLHLPVCINCSCIFSDDVTLASHALICATAQL